MGEKYCSMGRGVVDAVQRTQEITADEAASIDPSKVDMAKRFYENAVQNGRGGEAASARVELVQRI